MNSPAHEAAGRNSKPPGTRTLVIGYGNGLRRDDGAGPAVAGLIRQQGLPGVSVEIFHQLLPEHAVNIATAELVIFVDAIQSGADGIHLRRIQSSVHSEFCGHQCDPETLLYWCGMLASKVPNAWFVNIPGTDFGHGEGLSPASMRHVRLAVISILGIIRNHS